MEWAAPPGFGGFETCIVIDGDDDIESRHITNDTSCGIIGGRSKGILKGKMFENPFEQK